MFLHADPVAQDGATGVRAAGIDGNHAHGLPFLANQTRELIAQRAFTGSRRPRDAQNQCAAGVREKLAQQRLGFRTAVFDPRCGASQRAQVAIEDFFGGAHTVSSFA